MFDEQRKQRDREVVEKFMDDLKRILLEAVEMGHDVHVDYKIDREAIHQPGGGTDYKWLGKQWILSLGRFAQKAKAEEEIEQIR